MNLILISSLIEKKGAFFKIGCCSHYDPIPESYSSIHTEIWAKTGWQFSFLYYLDMKVTSLFTLQIFIDTVVHDCLSYTMYNNLNQCAFSATNVNSFPLTISDSLFPPTHSLLATSGADI